jgi:hypothetical protein
MLEPAHTPPVLATAALPGNAAASQSSTAPVVEKAGVTSAPHPTEKSDNALYLFALNRGYEIMTGVFCAMVAGVLLAPASETSARRRAMASAL